MNARSYLLFFSLSLALAPAAPADEPTSKPKVSLPASAIRGQITELLKQDAGKAPVKSKDATVPHLDPPQNDQPVNDQPVAEGILELEPIKVTEKKTLNLPRRINPVTLDNFFYGDGTIFESASKRFSITSGRDALIKFNFKF